MTLRPRRHRHRPRRAHYLPHVPGTAPGTLRAPENARMPQITLIAYDGDHLVEAVLASAQEAAPYLQKYPVSWINIDGLGSVDVIEHFGRQFGLHPLALEDVLNPYHRPKTEMFGDITFIILRMARIVDHGLDIEQLSLFSGPRFILTFQEQGGDCFDVVRDRLRRGAGRRIRTDGPRYLAYTLIDAVVDGYFPVLDHFSELIDALEDEVVFRPNQSTIQQTHEIKRSMNALRHGIWPMRDMLSSFSNDPDLADEAMRPYLRDCYDHLTQVLDLLETYRERTGSLVDVYLSSISNRMNEVMKVLTIIATIFIPLSFISGVYGMNFDTSSPWNMPELHWRFGYFYALGLMAAVAGLLLTYFARKGWLSDRDDSGPG